MDNNIFICYAPEDYGYAQKIRDQLMKDNISCMMSERINSQQDIQDKIGQCNAFILILSSRAQNSEQVTEELRLAMNLKKRILPYMIENFVLSDEYEFYLNNVQRYFAFNDNDREMQKLVDAIRESASTSETVSVSKEGAKQNKHFRKWAIPVIAVLFVLGLFVFNRDQSAFIENVDTDLPANDQEQIWEIGEISTNIWTDKKGFTWVEILCPITNTGSGNLKLNPTEMELEGPDRNIIDMVYFLSGFPNIIKPGETGYYYAERMLYEGSPKELVLVPNVQIEQTEEELAILETSDITITDVEKDIIQFSGKIKNNTDKIINKEDEYFHCIVAATLYDSKDNAIGLIFKKVYDEIAPGSAVDFSEKYYTLGVPEDIDHYKVTAYSQYIEYTDMNSY